MTVLSRTLSAANRVVWHGACSRASWCRAGPSSAAGPAGSGREPGFGSSRRATARWRGPADRHRAAGSSSASIPPLSQALMKLALNYLRQGHSQRVAGAAQRRTTITLGFGDPSPSASREMREGQTAVPRKRPTRPGAVCPKRSCSAPHTAPVRPAPSGASVSLEPTAVCKLDSTVASRRPRRCICRAMRSRIDRAIRRSVDQQASPKIGMPRSHAPVPAKQRAPPGDALGAGVQIAGVGRTGGEAGCKAHLLDVAVGATKALQVGCLAGALLCPGCSRPRHTTPQEA